MLNEIKSNTAWYTEYAGAFMQARQAGAAEDAAHLAARQFADRNMPAPGSAAFNTLLENIATFLLHKVVVLLLIEVICTMWKVFTTSKMKLSFWI
jgi:hypothetical protein